MSHTCIHCGFEIEHMFCPKCGQTKYVPKIDKKFILHDLQHGIFHFDNSFLYTLFSLYREPAVVIKNFINGNRKKYANPFTLIVFLATLYTIASTQLILIGPTASVLKNNSFSINGVIHNQTWLILLILPILSFLTYTFFKKSGYEYFEILVFECFIQAKIIIINFVFLPLYYFFPQQPFFNVLSFILIGVVAIRAKVLFFDKFSFVQVLIKSILTMLISAIVSIILLTLISIILSSF